MRIIDEVEEQRRLVLTTTTVKTNLSYTNLSYTSPGSDGQAIVELLAVSQVMLEIYPNIKICIMIKATRNVFRPYFYVPAIDMLIRTNCDIKLSGNYNETLIGHHL